MCRRTRQQAAMSRRTRRADQQQPAAASTPKIVSNPIFSCEDGFDRLIPAGSVHARVHDVPDDVPASAASGVGKPLPLPPSRTHFLPGSRGAGPALLMSTPCWVTRRVPDDPFLAAYVACTKSGGNDSAPVKQRKKEKRADTFRGCGIWNGWAAGAKFAGAMSCKQYGCAVNVQQADGPGPAAAAQAQQASPGPRLYLSRPLAMLPARERALARRRAQS